MYTYMHAYIHTKRVTTAPCSCALTPADTAPSAHGVLTHGIVLGLDICLARHIYLCAHVCIVHV